MADTVVITGATSGIGADFARAYAEQGYSLILTGRRHEKLDALAEEIRKETGQTVETRIVEFADRAQTRGLASELGELDDVEVLVNNAGFGLSADFGSAETDGLLDMLEVHTRAPLELIRSVIPAMQRRGSGVIINVASVAAWSPLPRSSVYSSTKAFLVRFSEALAIELRDKGITVQALCPGLTRTDFHDRMGIAGKEISRRRMMVWMSSEAVVRSSMRAVRRARVVVVPGLFNRLLVWMLMYLPSRILYAAGRRLRASSDE